MKHIILDTNFILIPAQFRVDIFEEIKRICDFKYELSILDKTKDELKKIMETQRGKHKRAASLGIQLLKSKKVKTLITKTDKYVDDLLVEYSKKDYIVATQDLGLKRRLKRNYITLKKKQFLILVK